jgi:2-oxoglutarate ferredoxin oxidoreductase subunit gamma
MNKSVYRILLAGEGGQGVQTIGHILARAAFDEGLNVAFMPNYGVEQRGGVSLAYLQIGKGVIGFPKFAKADIIINMRSRAVERIMQYVGDETLYIYDSDLIRSLDLKAVKAEKLPIPATTLAAKKLTPKVFNMILCGSLIAEIDGLSQSSVEKAANLVLAEKYKKRPELKNLNHKAIDLGVRAAKEAYK